MTSPNRRSLISAIYDHASKGPKQPNPKHVLLANRLNKLGPGELLPLGNGIKHLSNLHPVIGNQIFKAANHCIQEEMFGKYSRPREQILKQHGVDTSASYKMVDQIEAEAVALAVIMKRGDDSQLPIPEITRRDVIAAAIGD